MNIPPPRRAAVALAIAATLGLIGAACGGDDDGSQGAGDTTAATGGELPELPPELQAELRPVEVSGAALPRLDSRDDADIPADPAVGTPAPVITGQDFDNAPVRIDAAQDGPTMVVFLAHWCPHCNNEIPEINELRDDGRIPDGLNVIGVPTGTDPGRPNFPPSKWLDDMDWTYPVLVDDYLVEADGVSVVAGDAFGLSGFPFVTLIDGDGNVAARWSGERGADTIAELIATYLPGL